MTSCPSAVPRRGSDVALPGGLRYAECVNCGGSIWQSIIQAASRWRHKQ